MKITFICAVFPPEPAPAGLMAQQLAKRLVRDGHSVTMVVPFPNRPEGVLYPGFRRRLRTRSQSPDGYTIVHCANWLIGNRRRVRDRLLENITFGMSSTWAALREGRPDLIIIETWALFAATFTAMLARGGAFPICTMSRISFPSLRNRLACFMQTECLPDSSDPGTALCACIAPAPLSYPKRCAAWRPRTETCPWTPSA